jgi:hypothetical protein
VFLLSQIISIIYTVRLLLLLSDRLNAVVVPDHVKLTLTGVLALFPVLSSSVLSIFFALNLLTISRALTVETIFSSYGDTHAFNIWFANFIGGWFVASVVGLFVFSAHSVVLRAVLKKFARQLYIATSIAFISCFLGVLFIFIVIIEFVPFIHLCLFYLLSLIKKLF